MAERAARKQAAPKKAPAKRAPAQKAPAKKAPAKTNPAERPAAPKAARRQATTPSTIAHVPALLVGRIPMTDPWPVVESGRMPAKAVVGEQVLMRVTAFREGHGSLGVEVVLRDPAGREHSRQRMRDLGTGEQTAVPVGELFERVRGTVA